MAGTLTRVLTLCAVDERDVVEELVLVDRVLELHDVVAAQLVGLGDLERDAAVLGVAVRFGVAAALRDLLGLGGRAGGADGPHVDGVVAFVDYDGGAEGFGFGLVGLAGCEVLRGFEGYDGAFLGEGAEGEEGGGEEVGGLHCGWLGFGTMVFGKMMFGKMMFGREWSSEVEDDDVEMNGRLRASFILFEALGPSRRLNQPWALTSRFGS